MKSAALMTPKVKLTNFDILIVFHQLAPLIVIYASILIIKQTECGEAE